MASDDSFKTTQGFKSYVSKPEITALAPTYLVKGSKNVLIDYAQRVVSRNGYTLFGVAGTGSKIIQSFEWQTSTGTELPIRTWGSVIEFYWNNTWNTLRTALASVDFQFATVWDDTEKIDVILGVNGESNTYKWSGAVSKIASATSTTLTKQGVMTSKTTIGFVAGTPGLIAATITDSGNGFLTAGFGAGDTLNVTGSASNSRIFKVGSVTAGIITLVMSETLVTEAAGPSVTLHNGFPTWASARFFTTGTRSININGTSYTYTGGESTDTLTGVATLPAITAGQASWQDSSVIANPMSIDASFKQDLIGVQLNQVILASTKSRLVFGSSTSSYTNFTLTSPRAPGDPFRVTMDNYCTCIIPTDNQAQTVTSVIFGGGTSEFFKLNFQIDQNNTYELVRMIKLKTAIGSGLISKNGICSIKNATAYLSREPSLDILGYVESIEGANNVPISDAIKDDFDSYDFTNAHTKYFKRGIYIAVPSQGIVLIYDLMRKLWQPPQTIPISRLAIIGDELYGHSSITNESYKLFDGTDDNGIFISQVARFAYNNGGRRDRVKNMSAYWSDGYITQNATLTMKQMLGFDGSASKKTMMITGSDTDVVVSGGASGLGDAPLGQNPLGGAESTPISGLPSQAGTMLRFYQEDSMDQIDFFESYVEYSMNTKGGQFAIVAHGNNQWDAGTSPITHKK